MHAFFIKAQTEQNRLDLVLLNPTIFVCLQDATGFFVNGLVLEVDVLLQVSNGVVFGNVDASAVNALLAQDHFKERRLAAAVTAYEAHAFVVAYKETRPVQKDLLAKGFGYVLDLNHGNKDRNSIFGDMKTFMALCLLLAASAFAQLVQTKTPVEHSVRLDTSAKPMVYTDGPQASKNAALTDARASMDSREYSNDSTTGTLIGVGAEFVGQTMKNMLSPNSAEADAVELERTRR